MRRRFHKIATRFQNTKADLRHLRKVLRRRQRPREWKGTEKEEKL